MAELKIVNSEVHPLEKIFSDKFDVDFYQREYVWQRTQIEDLINDLSGEFLKCYKQGDKISDMVKYDPYYIKWYFRHICFTISKDYFIFCFS